MSLPEYCVDPIWCSDGRAKTRCHMNMSLGGDGWEHRIWKGGQQPWSAAQRPKEEHEMPISYDNPDAHALWHCMHLAMFTVFSVAFKDTTPCLLSSCFFLPIIPSCWSIELSYFRKLFVFVLSRMTFADFFLPHLLDCFTSSIPPSPLSFCIVSVVFTHHFSVRHET